MGKSSRAGSRSEKSLLEVGQEEAPSVRKSASERATRVSDGRTGCVLARCCFRWAWRGDGQRLLANCGGR